MYFYFSSNYPAVIKINGIFYGTLDSVVKTLRIEDDLCPYIEICSLKGDGNVNFILNQEFLSCPHESVCVTDLKGGYLIKVFQTRISSDFSILAQEKFENALVTVFNENGLKISIETTNDFYAETLKVCPTSASIKKFFCEQNELIAISLIAQKTFLSVYTLNPKIKKVFMREVDEYSLENGLETVENHKDIAKHVVTSCWSFDGENFTTNNTRVKKSENFNPDLLPDKIIPYAFLEALLTGDEINCFLGSNVLENADKLPGFFGNFLGIMPPPTFRKREEIGLLYSASNNRYSVEYYIFDVIDRKICNIKKAD